MPKLLEHNCDKYFTPVPCNSDVVAMHHLYIIILSISSLRQSPGNLVPEDLDDVCYENKWILPTYHVSLLDGGFQADVTVKGKGFECSSKGDLSPSPREARKSAAKQMLAKLQDMPNISW
ncbi:hypothetical protein NC652_019908 [Populus alba x Populus x berolinensis]|nr:hypothetical protein NC652_019908 [Populus alba x Populus x berolinensis]